MSSTGFSDSLHNGVVILADYNSEARANTVSALCLCSGPVQAQNTTWLGWGKGRVLARTGSDSTNTSGYCPNVSSGVFVATRTTSKYPVVSYKCCTRTVLGLTTVLSCQHNLLLQLVGFFHMVFLVIHGCRAYTDNIMRPSLLLSISFFYSLKTAAGALKSRSHITCFQSL